MTGALPTAMGLLARSGPVADRDTIRRTAEDVFSGGAYERHLSWWERFTRWLAERLGNQQPSLPGGGGAAAAGGLSAVLLYLLLVVVAAVVLFLVVLVVRRWTPRVRLDDDEPEVDVTEERTVREWRADADRAEADGRWKDAIRARFRELVGELVDRGVLDRVPGRTTGEFRIEIAERCPSAFDAFDRAALRFELPWYGDEPCGPEDLAALRAAAAETLDAAASVGAS